MGSLANVLSAGLPVWLVMDLWTHRTSPWCGSKEACAPLSVIRFAHRGFVVLEL
jgi:hypothetical protein